MHLPTFLLENASNYTLVELSKILNRSPDHIRHLCNDAKIKYKSPVSPKKVKADQQREFIAKHFPSKGSDYCARYLNITQKYVTLIASKLKVKKDRVNSIKENPYLSITPEMAYFLGYAWADGCLHIRKGGPLVFRFSIVSSDFINIMPVLQKLGINKFTESKRPLPAKPQLCFSTSDQKFCQFLRENDFLFKSGASALKILSKIPENLAHYWWRGYLDGDGCIFYKEQSVPYVSFHSCATQNWDFCIKFIESLNIKYKILSRNRAKSSGSSFLISSYQCVKLLRFIYQNYENDQIGLKRKYDKYFKIENHIAQSKDRRLSIYKNQEASSKST